MVEYLCDGETKFEQCNEPPSRRLSEETFKTGSDPSF
jgi:hypothetical protein